MYLVEMMMQEVCQNDELAKDKNLHSWVMVSCQGFRYIGTQALNSTRFKEESIACHIRLNTAITGSF